MGQSHGGKHRVERAQFGMLLEESEARVQVGCGRDDRAKRYRVEPGQPGRIFARAPAGPHVGKLLEHLNRRRGLDRPVGVGSQQTPTRFAKRVLVPDRIGEDRRVEDDHVGR